MDPRLITKPLESLYARYNRRELVHPDPLEFLYRYPNIRDREVVALLASSLAYGRVAQILRSVALVLDQMPSPAEFVQRTQARELERRFRGFKHRFTTGAELCALLLGIREALNTYGSLQECFMAGLKPQDGDVLPALSRFVARLQAPSGGKCGSLLACPGDGSACKRLNLFLRWMVRRDAVDPGGWEAVGPWRLIVPLDTHMHRISRALGLTRRRQADRRTAIEVTEAFRTICPNDPVRYDFALSRLGIRNDLDHEGFLAECKALRSVAGRRPSHVRSAHQEGRNAKN